MTLSRVTGILCFWDEPLDLLEESVSSLEGVVDHLVAVDGAYAAFPGGTPASDPSQMRLVGDICRDLDIGLTSYTPTSLWEGNEVEKRNRSLRLAEQVTDEEGWYFIQDGDTIVTWQAANWFDQVTAIPYDYGAAEIGIHQVPGSTTGLSPLRNMYRALRGMEYGPAHWIIHAPDPGTDEAVCIWGPASYRPIDAFDMTRALRMDHRKRPEARRISARKYYSRREREGLESTTQVYIKKLNGEYGPLKPLNR